MPSAAEPPARAYTSAMLGHKAVLWMSNTKPASLADTLKERKELAHMRRLTKPGVQIEIVALYSPGLLVVYEFVV